MTIDKSWTTLRNRASDKFNDGLDAFLKRCRDHLDEDNTCLCPCHKCNNNNRRTLKEIENDIVKNGFSASYTTWDQHGEPPVVNHTPEAYNELVDFLHDVRMENTNEPTEGPSASNEPEIETYFDMAPHLTGPNVKHVKDAVDAICGECYKGHKHRFKKYKFLKKDGYKDPDALRPFPPDQMPIDEWNKHINFFLEPAQMKKSETNSRNRSKQPYPSLQGTKSLAASRHARRKKGIDGNPDEYPSRIDDFGLMHKRKKTGAFVNEVAATKHKELEDAKKTTQESGENVPEIEILAKVLGTRSGHIPSVGRKLKGVSSSSSATSSSSSYYRASKTYTQEEMDEKTKIMKKSIRKQVAASVNKKFEKLLAQLAGKGISLDKDDVVGDEDEEYEESDDDGMENEDDGMENEDDDGMQNEDE